MPTVRLTPTLSREYDQLFESCQITPERLNTVERSVERILESRGRYEAVSSQLGTPWYVIAVIHNMESGLRFDRHLHNGDPLTARTVHVPAGRPVRGNPPFSWEESAEDALRLHKLHQWTDWSLAGALYQIEAFNGWGYRLYHPEVRSPYLWSFSNHYSSGKYVADGTWSNTARSEQCGAAVLLRRLAEHGLVQSRPQPDPEPEEPDLRYSPAVRSVKIEELQRFMNRLGEPVLVDGKAGNRTSDAFRRLTGYYLHGDPRI